MRYHTAVLCFSLCCAGAPLCAQTTQGSEYSGPSILSRGGPAAQIGGSEEFLRLRPYASLMSFYDTGITGVAVDPQGRIPKTDSWGVQASFGAVGRHRWRRSGLGMTYRGSFRHYAKNDYYDGMDNTLGLVYMRQATRRITFVLAESAGLFHGGYYGQVGARFYDPSFTAIGQNLLFDNRTLVMTSTGRVIYQKSARLSFSASGRGTIMEPRSRALVGIRGTGASGDVSYRLGRNQSIGFAYNFKHYEYAGLFGSTDLHGLALMYSRRLGRYWELDLSLGGDRLETLRLERVRLDPVIAAILGQRLGVEAFYRILYVPDIEVKLSRNYRRSALALMYSRQVTPGNGLFLSSGHETAQGVYSFSGTRRLNFGLNGGFSKLRSFAQTIGNYRSYYGGVGTSYRLSGILHLNASFDSRTFRIAGSDFGRPYHRMSVGLSISPGEFPLALW